MSPVDHWFFWLFAFFYLLHHAIEFGLDLLNLGELKRHEDQIPPLFRSSFSDEDYRKSIAYTRAKTRYGWAETAFDIVILAAFVFTGAFDRLYLLLGEVFPRNSLLHLVSYPLALGGVFYLLKLPFSVYFQFVLEERFGFNKTKPATFVVDQLKTLLLSLVIGAPLLALIFWLVGRLGESWWLAAFGVVMVFQFLTAALFPVLLAPLFYKFTPLEAGELKNRLETLAREIQFKMSGVFTIDGSRRSSHSNAFFAGMGKARRIVLFDTLVENLSTDEIVAVIAHEMGHNKKKHIGKGLILSSLMTLLAFFVLARLLEWPPFFQAFGVPAPNLAIGFVLFSLVSGVFTFPAQPLLQWISRRNEYEADRFSVMIVKDKGAMASSLIKLSKDNLSNLTPHPWYSFYHYSHPTTSERVRAIEALAPESGAA